MNTLRLLPVRGVAVLDYAHGKATGRYKLVGRKLVKVPVADLFAAAQAGCSRVVGYGGVFALPEAFADCDIVRERDPIDVGDEFYVECWPMTGDSVTVSGDGEAGMYFRARVREGGLLPADAATAQACGVKLQGGE